MIRIAICEDDPAQLETLCQRLGHYMRLHPEHAFSQHSFLAPADLSACIEAGEKFDLYLLDILMPGQNGIELARAVRDKDPCAELLFLTSSPDYALDSYLVHGHHYLLKPFCNRQLYEILDEWLAHYQFDTSQRFLLRSAPGEASFFFHELIYAEYNAHRLFCTLGDGRILKSTTLRTPFSEIARPLLADPRFCLLYTSRCV